MYLATRRHHGRVFLSPFDVIFTKFDVVEPDLLFIAGDQLDILIKQNVQGPPALVVEILSPGTRRKDERLKRDLCCSLKTEAGGCRNCHLRRDATSQALRDARRRHVKIRAKSGPTNRERDVHYSPPRA